VIIPVPLLDNFDQTAQRAKIFKKEGLKSGILFLGKKPRHSLSQNAKKRAAVRGRHGRVLLARCRHSAPSRRRQRGRPFEARIGKNISTLS
jgi:hypothetical protein